MKQSIATMIGLVFLAGLAHAAPPGHRVDSGDRNLDATLQRIEIEARSDPDGYLKQLSTRNNIPEQEIRQARETHGLGLSDLFMATSLANATHRPVLVVAEQYKQNQGKGWGVMAKEMGVKPGSPAFHEMKRGAKGCLDHVRSTAKSKQKHERQMKQEHERKMKQESRGQGHGKSH